jgi:hypothetical protein
MRDAWDATTARRAHLLEGELQQMRDAWDATTARRAHLLEGELQQMHDAWDATTARRAHLLEGELQQMRDAWDATTARRAHLLEGELQQLHDRAHGHCALLAVQVVGSSAPQGGLLRRIRRHGQKVVQLPHGVQGCLYARRHL